MHQKLKPSHFPDDPEVLPEGSVIDGKTVEGDITDSADYVVVGSGAGGATAALTLAQAGYSVIIIEDGAWVRTREFGVDVYPAMKTLFRDMAAVMTVGTPMLSVLQGACVGGSTTINSAIAWRIPEPVVNKWNTHYGLKGAITYQALEEHYNELDRNLGVRPVDDESLGSHNALFSEAAQKLGVKAQRIHRYDGGCLGSASCLTGCRSGRKLSMNITHVPQALQKGAKIYTSTRAVKVETKYGRARAVRGTFKAPGGPALLAIAKRGVVVAASAVQTPGVIRRSGVRLKALGKHFQAHTGTTLTARFDRNVSMQNGATQGFNSTHFVDSNQFKIESLSLPPELISMRIPGVGPELVRNLFDYKHAINWALVVRAEAEGHIGSLFGKDMVHFTPTITDIARVRRGLKIMSEMMFAAGAKEVWPGIHGMKMMTSPNDLRHWDEATLDPKAYSMMLSHMFGSTRMGPDARTSVVGLDFQVHGVRGMYVLDSSIFPTNIGVNPQHTIMAVSRLGATRIVEKPLPALS